MSKEEFVKFCMILKTAYPKENLLPTKEAMSIWYKMLMDIPYKIAEITLEKWISTNKWPPSIADIREYATNIGKEEVPDWGDAWREVTKAISKYGYYNEERALNSMRPLTREVVDRLGFRNLCVSENPAADRANFRKCYEIMEQRRKENAQLPELLLQTIQAFQIGDRRHEDKLDTFRQTLLEEKQPTNDPEQDYGEVVSNPIERISEIREILQRIPEAV